MSTCGLSNKVCIEEGNSESVQVTLAVLYLFFKAVKVL